MQVRFCLNTSVFKITFKNKLTCIFLSISLLKKHFAFVDPVHIHDKREENNRKINKYRSLSHCFRKVEHNPCQQKVKKQHVGFEV